MIRSLQEAAQDLMDALTEAAAVYGLQQQQAQAARQSAEAHHQQFLSLLTAQQSETLEADTEQQRRQWWEQKSTFSPQRQLERLTDSLSLSRRWEQVLGDSQIALMRLYAFPEARESAEHIAGLLQSLRLLQIAEPPRAAPPLPSSPGSNEDAQPETDGKKQKVAMALDFMRGLEGYASEVRQSYQEKSSRTEELLKRACKAAEELARRLRA